MVITACQCDAAPMAHTHSTELVIRRLDDGEVFTMHSLWIEQDGYEVLTRRETLHLCVRWKDVARELLTSGAS